VPRISAPDALALHPIRVLSPVAAVYPAEIVHPAPSHAAAPDALSAPLLVLFVVACLLILSTVHVGDPDLWGHVRYGEDVLATGRIPATATHTYTAPTHPWINHENASEVIFAALVDHFGPAGLTGLTIALGARVVLAFVLYGMRSGVRLPAFLAVVLLAVCNMTPGWSVRPQVFTYVFFTILLVVLDRGLAGRAPRRLLWILPPVFMVLANTHDGFVAGLAVLTLYVFVQAAVAIASSGGRIAWREVLGLGGVVLASACATLLNPYGPRLLTWLAEDLRPPRPEISEWGPM